MPLKRRATSTLVLAVVMLSAAPSLFAQIELIREHHGKQISCWLSGLRGFSSPCGLDGNYAYILTGTVSVSRRRIGQRETPAIKTAGVLSGRP
jgi:hypothetical protein